VTVQARTQSRSTGPTELVGGLEATAERLVEPAVVVALVALGVALLLPLAPLALPVAGALRRLRDRPWVVRGLAYAAAVLPAAGAALWLRWTGRAGPVEVAAGYVLLHTDAGRAVLAAWPDVPWGAVGLAYARGAWPYLLVGGPLAGAAAFGAFGLWLRAREGTEGRLEFEDLGRLAARADRPVPWAVPDVVGRGVLSLLSAPPGGGKGWWALALVKAMQDGEAFYGLRTRAMRVLWCTEEGESLARSARAFGIKPGTVVTLRRDRVRGRTWPALLKAIRREAWRRGCGLVIVDTVRAWCPQAEVSNDQAAEVMNLARAELVEPGLALLFLHHDRKGGGQWGEGVAGAYNLVGSSDVLIELRRVSDDPEDPRRRMVTSRRYKPLDLTAALIDGRYVVEGQRAPPAPAPPPREAPPKPPAHLRETVAYLRGKAAAGELQPVIAEALGLSAGATSERLAACEAAGLVERVPGGGRKQRWRARQEGMGGHVSGDPLTAAPGRPRRRPAVPARLRHEVLSRDGHRCTSCGRGPSDGAELHLDHVLPVRDGGATTADNLRTLCADCNLGKG
jgi:hypothetical protein